MAALWSARILLRSSSSLLFAPFQVDEGKASLAGGSQAASHGVVDVSEEEDLQAVEEVRTLFTEHFIQKDKLGTRLQ